MSLAQQSNDQLRHRLGQRLRAARRSRSLTQAAVAERAGISRPTLSALERGKDVSLDTFLSVLRALDLLDGLDVAVPEAAISPIAELERSSRHRSSRPGGGQPSTWSWGDEPAGQGSAGTT